MPVSSIPQNLSFNLEEIILRLLYTLPGCAPSTRETTLELMVSQKTKFVTPGTSHLSRAIPIFSNAPRIWILEPARTIRVFVAAHASQIWKCSKRPSTYTILDSKFGFLVTGSAVELGSLETQNDLRHPFLQFFRSHAQAHRVLLFVSETSQSKVFAGYIPSVCRTSLMSKDWM